MIVIEMTAWSGMFGRVHLERQVSEQEVDLLSRDDIVVSLRRSRRLAAELAVEMVDDMARALGCQDVAETVSRSATVAEETQEQE